MTATPRFNYITAEQQAVLDAAEKEVDEVWADALDGLHPAVADTIKAVRALRESRRPKPRWRLEENGLCVTDGYTVVRATYENIMANSYVSAFARTEVLKRILDALNRAEPV